MRPLRLLRIFLLPAIAVISVAGNIPCHADEAAAAGTPAAESPEFTAEELEFFEKQVRPLLAQHCYECHSVDSESLQAGLLMDSRAGLLTGGDSGEAIVPGDVDGSLVIEAVRYESYEMPPKGKLADADIEVLEEWIAMGAPWPQEDAPIAGGDRPVFDLQQRKADHWVWQPVQPQTPPVVADTAWPRSELDHFILAKLEAAELQPAADADRTALIRRLYFDLIGLPPTPEQVQAVLKDPRPQAIEELVDRLLESPQFGERWGRHWLDLVRYAESRGHEFDADAPNAFQYRDYVIRALNADVPYDQLIREHIAGDLLASPRLHPQDGFNESILGTGFWFLGEWVHSPVDIRKDEADRFDNMIDVMSKAFLGVTVACARCHDHKFDPISTADYYSLTGFLQSSDYRQVRFESLEHNRQVARKLAELDDGYREKIQQLLAGAAPAIETPVTETPVTETPEGAIDYASLPEDQYMQDGFLFGSEPRRAGEVFLDAVDGQPHLRVARRNAAVSDDFWQGLKSVSGAATNQQGRLETLPRSGRTLRTPTITLHDGQIACRVRGSGHIVACVDSHRLIAGPLHGQTVADIKPDQAWVRMNLDRYVGHRVHFELTPSEGAALEVSYLVQGADGAILKAFEEREAAIRAAAQKQQQTLDELVAADGEAAQKIKQWTASWAAEREQLKAQVRHTSQLAMAMMDGSGEDGQVLIRGNASNPGEVEPRHFLTAVSGDEPLQIATHSGRLELAAKINDPANPLSSRVMVNRIWHHLLGRGIVPTTDDFGVLGQQPTHPELLDHLALRFQTDGQSIKQMIRYIVLSRTYQMGSRADAHALQTDPKNLLWHHRPPKRLEGEAIRDGLLAISGQLDASMFGPSVPIHLTNFMDGRGRPGTNGPLDGAARRSIYIAVRRNFLSPFMLTFDTPVPFSTMGRRNVSNVPAQALILMNDPFVVSQATAWAQRAMQAVPVSTPAAQAGAPAQIDTAAELQQRVDWMYQTGLGRSASERERQIAMAFLSAQSQSRGLDVTAETLWADLAHALINTKEFIFLR